MNWTSIEQAFSRALLYSFSKKKMMITFPALVLCGVLIVFCRAVAFNANDWVAMSLTFLPILLSSSVLLALGVLLIRIHTHEVRALSLSFSKLVIGSLDLMVGTSYLSIPPILAYLIVWMVLGFFFLLKEIPGVGHFFSVVLAFAPFLLIFISLLLCLFALALLFFVTPAAAFHSFKRISMAKKIVAQFQGHILSSLTLFILALIPITLIVGFLSLAAVLTNVSFFVQAESLSVALEWFFIMLPFAAILTPAVVFFFNFSAESYQLLKNQTS